MSISIVMTRVYFSSTTVIYQLFIKIISSWNYFEEHLLTMYSSDISNFHTLVWSTIIDEAILITDTFYTYFLFIFSFYGRAGTRHPTLKVRGLREDRYTYESKSWVRINFFMKWLILTLQVFSFIKEFNPYL